MQERRFTPLPRPHAGYRRREVASASQRSERPFDSNAHARKIRSSHRPRKAMTPQAILDQYGPREAMEYDVVVVGAGPGGLATAIRIKQLAAEQGKDVSVVVLEKGSEPRAHILSGAVMDPRAITELLPNWKELGAPLNQQVTADDVLYLTEKGAMRTPD